MQLGQRSLHVLLSGDSLKLRTTMKTRVLVPELMDDPDLDRTEHFRALAGLQRINRWTGNASLAWRQVKRLATQRNLDRLRILDIATGAADIPIQLCLLAKAAGLAVEIEACDISPQALELARENCDRAGVSVSLLALDVLTEPIAERYDIVHCSQFLHHLTDEEAEEVLRKMAAAATRQVIAVDLVRSRLNWWQVWLGTRVLSRSSVVHFDGPQSVRAAFTMDEMKSIAERVGFARCAITSHWPCRFTLVGDVSHD
jgi:2-polyprenyl-3-methyl-5-hydroxy-6-metoxy-1,4-benzoquinol methylase